MSFMNPKKLMEEGFFSDFKRVYKQIRKTQKVKKLAKKDASVAKDLKQMERNVELINKLGSEFEKDFEAVFGEKPKVSNKKVKLSDFF